MRRINLKWILLNQLKLILDKLFTILRRLYQPMQWYVRVGFSSFALASFSWFAQVIVKVRAIAARHVNTWYIEFELVAFYPEIAIQKLTFVNHFSWIPLFLSVKKKFFENTFS